MKKRSLGRDTGGAIYVEFLLAFIPLFFMFLGMLQMGLLYGASLVVQHSANTAARAAIVVMDDDPQYYDDEPRREVRTEATGISSFMNAANGIIGSFFGSSSSGPAWTGGARLQAIEFAASMPLLPLSPSLSSIARLPQDESVRGALGMTGMDSPEARVAWGLVYNRMALRVTFPRQAGRTGDYNTSFPAPSGEGDAGQVITRVTYLYNCQIPLANRLMCEDLVFIRTGIQAGAIASLTQQFIAGTLTFDQFQAAMAAMQARSARRDRWRDRINEFGDGLNALTLLAGISAIAGGPIPRFVPISAEASMPFQAANYRYHGGSDSVGWAQQADNGS